MFMLKAFVFFGAAVLIAVYGNPNVSPEHLWAFVATYALTGIIFALFGILLDAREDARRPQQVDVLLRHDSESWLLPVMRNHTGEVYAPLDPSMRIMKPVALHQLPEDILGSPRFYTSRDWDGTSVRTFRILGKDYIVQS
jgi:hypothetical protein